MCSVTQSVLAVKFVLADGVFIQANKSIVKSYVFASLLYPAVLSRQAPRSF